MERRQIEYFLAVIDHGGITAAARRLHVSQPALSHAIKLLEADLGAELFQRIPRGVRLTAAGEAFAVSARRIVREFETGRAAVNSVVGLVAGRLDMIALPGALLDPLAGVIGRFRALYPHVQVRVTDAARPEHVRDAVRSGTAEIGVTEGKDRGDRDLARELVTLQEMVVALPPGSPPPPGGMIPVRDLMDMQLVTGVRDMVVELLTQAGVEHASEFTPVVETGLRGSALHLVMAGAGAAVLPRTLAEIGRPHGVVIAPLDPPQHRACYALHQRAPLSPAADRMLDLIRPTRARGDTATSNNPHSDTRTSSSVDERLTKPEHDC